jgi:riboflavin biosynthesis pyrimidine reductase
VLLGATLSGAALRAALVDEVIVHVVPILLGDGVRLNAGNAPPMRLELVEGLMSNDLATLRYRPDRRGSPNTDHV